MINKKLESIRRKLDNLDNHFLSLIKKRTLLVNQVLLTKKFKNQIVDKKRIKKILANIKSKSIKKNIDVKITNEIWKSMIRAYIKYEFRNLKNKTIYCAVVIFSTKNSCFRVLGLYFLIFNFTCLFTFCWFFCIINKCTIWFTFRYHSYFKMCFLAMFFYPLIF